MTKGELNYWITLKLNGQILLSLVTSAGDKYQETHLAFHRDKIVFAGFDINGLNDMKVKILFDYDRWFETALANPLAHHPAAEKEQAYEEYGKNYEAFNALHSAITKAMMSIGKEEFTEKGEYEVYPV